MPTHSSRTPDTTPAPSEARPRSSYDYALIRVVPRVERGEFLNVGAVLFCRTRRFLRLTLAIDERRLLALAPDLDLAAVQGHLDALAQIAEGHSDGGPVAALGQAERFHWIVAPASAMIQPSPVHCGLCAEPAAALERILDELVRYPRPSTFEGTP